MEQSIILDERKNYHKLIIENQILNLSPNGIASNADSSNAPSVAIAKIVAEKLNAAVGTKLKGQTSGNLFEKVTMNFLEKTFPRLKHLRPGNWEILNLGNQSNIKTSDFAQYEHLAYLSEIISQNKLLATTLGNDYIVAPDIVIYRKLYDDADINHGENFITDEICKMADLRVMAESPFYTLLFLLNGL